VKIAVSLITLLPLALASGLASASQYYPPDQLAKVIQGPQRSVAHKLRDKYRHPHATLQFFGLKPDMTVVELVPGSSGWYTEILAPYLKDHGHLIEAAPPLNSKRKFEQQSAKKFRQKLKADPAIYGKIKLVPFAPPKQVKLGSANSADMVLTFRNAHDWKEEGALKSVLKAVYKVLKPGGVFGVVGHRANPDTDPATDAKKLSRLPEAYVINVAQQAGFKLDATSRINANPADPRTESIFLLPPTRAVAKGYRQAFDHVIDASKTKHSKQLKEFIQGLQPVFDHIGETDRMTLKFVKAKG
jgi:predicted methyltransferase